MDKVPDLYNRILDSYTIWNGSVWEDIDVHGAYFYTIEIANNNGYFEICNS